MQHLSLHISSLLIQRVLLWPHWVGWSPPMPVEIEPLKYGTTKHYVWGLEVVLSDGRIINTGSILGKTSSGYDLTHLFTNAEGTLGIITKIILKILPMPEYIAFGEARFLLHPGCR